MGRGKRGRGGGGGGGRGRGRGGGRGGRGGGGQSVDNRVSFANVVKENEKLERYYNTINMIPIGEERDAFWTALRRELPNSFRFTGSKGDALRVRDNLVSRFFPYISKITYEEKAVELPQVIPWYPDGLAYSMTTPKNVIRKYDHFKDFQKFLVSETLAGNISRQEAVSMIPPLVLDIKPEHTVLDMCAAPGSKSAQLVEMIHNGEEARVEKAIKNARGQPGEEEFPDGGRALGLLIANDVHYNRARLLIHQVKRLNSPNLIVTNHDATMFPSIALPTLPGEKNKYLRFDRILADVPCSGDGTCRKNPNIWKDWAPANGLGLYCTQVRILTRALQLLKAGGRVVYSTCSMNPIENEAVVASAIERCGGVGKVKLVDCHDRLPNLIRKPGLTDWSIMSKGGQIYESWPEAEQFEAADSKVVPGMFPPEPEEQIPLQNCMRVYPHLQDTGAFFIAVLEVGEGVVAKPEIESKCYKKDWVFSEHKKATTGPDATSTTFMKIAEEIETEPMDEDGHLHREGTNGSVNTEGNTSAAARQNAPVGEILNNGKRKADEELDGSALKLPKLDGDEIVADPAVNGDAHNATDDTSGTSLVLPDVTLEPLRKVRRDGHEAAVESFKYLASDHPELLSVYDFYELHPEFPRNRFLVRNPAGDPVKGIYYSSQLVKDILLANEGRKMKFVHAGVKMFVKQDAQGQDICRWRIQTEGLPIIEGWVGQSRVIRMWQKSTLRTLLVEMFPRVGRADEPEGQGWKALGEIGEQVLNIGMGCCILRVEARGGADGLDQPITLPLWKSVNSVNLMLPKEDRKAMLLRIYEEDVALVNHGEKAKQPIRGSIPAEDDAIEVQRRMDEDDEVDVELEEDGGLDGAARALEEDAVASRDALEAEKLQEMEDVNTKITNAMPERDHEGDDYNTTI